MNQQLGGEGRGGEGRGGEGRGGERKGGEGRGRNGSTFTLSTDKGGECLLLRGTLLKECLCRDKYIILTAGH